MTETYVSEVLIDTNNIKNTRKNTVFELKSVDEAIFFPQNISFAKLNVKYQQLSRFFLRF